MDRVARPVGLRASRVIRQVFVLPSTMPAAAAGSRAADERMAAFAGNLRPDERLERAGFVVVKTPFAATAITRSFNQLPFGQ